MPIMSALQPSPVWASRFSDRTRRSVDRSGSAGWRDQRAGTRWLHHGY